MYSSTSLKWPVKASSKTLLKKFTLTKKMKAQLQLPKKYPTPHQQMPPTLQCLHRIHQHKFMGTPPISPSVKYLPIKLLGILTTKCAILKELRDWVLTNSDWMHANLLIHTFFLTWSARQIRLFVYRRQNFYTPRYKGGLYRRHPQHAARRLGDDGYGHPYLVAVCESELADQNHQKHAAH